MTAPAPSPAEQAVIERFGIFAEERVIEEVARAIRAACSHSSMSGPETYRRLAAAAVAGYRAQDGGAEEAVRLDPICSDCEDHADGSRTCDPERPACPSGMKRRAKALLAPAREEIASIRAALAPQAGEAGQ